MYCINKLIKFDIYYIIFYRILLLYCKLSFSNNSNLVSFYIYMYKILRPKKFIEHHRITCFI